MESSQAPCSCSSAEAPEPVLDWQSINNTTSLTNHSHHLFRVLDILHGQRVHSGDCNCSYIQEFAPIVASMPHLREGLEDALPEAEEYEETALQLANTVKEGRIRVKLARLQVRYALGVLLDSMAGLDIAEALTHSVLHQSPELRPVYAEVSRDVRKRMYLNMEANTRPLMPLELALLRAYEVDLSSIKRPETLQQLEKDINKAFERMRFEPPRTSESSQSSRSSSPREE
ncbi:hypothetical protein BKA70DRAFT_1220685 [Coprinopsis sp. MPI-PUGE-AT-0042]|nr:hypothetical protein BKA70DRAFT_1220685 [Coprinopsis sp. MPI-PUGE-AT-0042]